ncbi:MAG: FAD-dependent monooxygenase [Aestuariivirgaceae bacterium]
MEQNRRDVDVVVAGAGTAGLATACLIAAAGHRPLLLAPADSLKPDPRTVALMQPAIRLLAAIGIWPGALAELSEKLVVLRIVDDRGGLVAAPALTMAAPEIGADCFGWNIPVEPLRRALLSRAASIGVARLEAPVKDLEPTRDRLVLHTDAGPVAARVAVAADGQGSALRSLAGIAVTEWSYPQEALAGSFGHSLPHGGTSTEYHKRAGPFTTVPLPGNRSSLVWMDRPERIQAALAMSDALFCSTLQAEMHGALGRISEPGPRRAFPMRGLLARRFVGERLLLVGEAAHLLPPIGAQGLNTSLRDGALAAELINDALDLGHDPGAAPLLDDYERRRRRDVMPRQAIVDLANRSLIASLLPVDLLRATGLGLVATVPWLRRLAMDTGLGASDELPLVMRG